MATTVLCGSLPYPALAFEDETMKQLEEVALLKGEKIDAMQQNALITRAEFMALANRILGFTNQSDTVSQYKDIVSDAWYYNDVARALEAKYIFGTSEEKMSPLDNITNQEMYAILTRLATAEEGSTKLSHVPDQMDITNWAKKGVEQAIINGYVVADKDHKLNPKKYTSREDAITLLENLKNQNKVFYCPCTYNIKSANNVTVLSNDVELKDAVIHGDLKLGENVNTVKLDNIKVDGKIVKENENVDIIGELAWKDGTFEGTARGENGILKVRVSVADGKITSIDILEHQENQESLNKIKKILQQVVKTGTFEGIDISNDKTITSEGFLNAIKDAIAQSSGETNKPGESPEAKQYQTLQDGTYEGIGQGYGGSLRLKIEVKDNKITNVEVLEHSETDSYFYSTQNMLKQIIEKGSIDEVDTVSGATVSSKAILNAIRDAMSQASGITEEVGESVAAMESNGGGRKRGRKPTEPQGNTYPEGSLIDGAYQGEATGFGGKIAVTVVVKGGKIAEINVDSHRETLSYYNKASKILNQIVEKNSTNIDTISGATVTSKGLLSAVENALSPNKEPLEYADGTWYGQ